MTDILSVVEVKKMCYEYGCGPSGRNFLTKDEKIEMLKEYKESLEKEAKGVGERIKEIEKGS